jgi:uncharacterized protein YecE (DUF72 family)
MQINRESTTNEIPEPCHIRVGTSGYSYAEWVEAGFYPPGTKGTDMLAFYARQFPVTELNYTWYQMPKAAAVERMRQRVPGTFAFAAKLTRTMTHEVDPHQWRGYVARYREGIAPLVRNRQLAAILIQMPPSFDRAPKNRFYLATLLDELAGLPLAVEFRHASWAKDRVFAELERRRVTLVSVDEPDLPGLFPRLDVVTNSDLFYIRFHGRNNRGWRSGNMQNQFDYDYSHAELAQWSAQKIPKMAAGTRKGVLFFNNHVRAQAPRNAIAIMEQLAQQGLVAAAVPTGDPVSA